MAELTEKDMIRYQRQIIIPELGARAQKKLKGTHVAVAGAGGLGSSVLMYLAAAGIGNITVIDFDKVELSNLNRQVIFSEKDVGRSKVKSAVENLQVINAGIHIVGVDDKITDKNAVSLLKGADAIVDCTDNFRTRYALNDAALKQDIPLFHAACYSFEGRVTTIVPGKTACLRCIIPVQPQDRGCPIVGPVAGMTGAIQATEVIKHFTGIGTTLQNKLLVFDTMFMRCNIIDIKRNPKCSSCGGR